MEEKMLIFVDTVDNHNKFYHIKLNGNDVNVEYGRVGATPQCVYYPGGSRVFSKKVKEKLRKGYVESHINLEATDVKVSANGNLLDIAMEQIKADSFGKELIKKLVQQNIHNITSSSKITYDIKTGYFKTDLGIVTQDGVDKATSLLNEILELVTKNTFKTTNKDKFIRLNQEYFTIIPTRINNLREFNSLLVSTDKINSQLDICSALTESIKIISDEKARIDSTDASTITKEVLFDVSISKLEDVNEFDRVVKFFNETKNKSHGHDSYKVLNVFNISIGKDDREFRYNLTNQMELFHGTKVANLLSIIKSGLLMPKYSPGASTGYMFGRGLYFANQSTKSLNYCDGMYWNRSGKQDKIYMFIADIAMGNYYVPSGSTSKNPDTGYDSYWAQAGKSGVMNDEFIVFNNNQIRLKYILEIGN